MDLPAIPALLRTAADERGRYAYIDNAKPFIDAAVAAGLLEATDAFVQRDTGETTTLGGVLSRRIPLVAMLRTYRLTGSGRIASTDRGGRADHS